MANQRRDSEQGASPDAPLEAAQWEDGDRAAGERILVCVSEDPRAVGLVRYTKRLADRVHAPWTAISIETRRSLQLSDAQRDRLADTLRLAESLGGEAITIPAVQRRIADD